MFDLSESLETMKNEIACAIKDLISKQLPAINPELDLGFTACPDAIVLRGQLTCGSVQGKEIPAAKDDGRLAWVQEAAEAHEAATRRERNTPSRAGRPGPAERQPKISCGRGGRGTTLWDVGSRRGANG